MLHMRQLNTLESRVIRIIHGRSHRTDNSILITTRSEQDGNRHTDRILTDTRITRQIETSMVKETVFGDRKMIILLRTDNHDLLL